jgi:hypothetical protein
LHEPDSFDTDRRRGEQFTHVRRLFFLDLSAGRTLSANPDGSDLKTIINDSRKLPDTGRAGRDRAADVSDTCL